MCGCGCDHVESHQSDSILLADFTVEETSFIETSVEKALKKIYTGNYKGEFPNEFWAITTGKLNEAVDAEFGKEYKPLSNQLKYQNGVFAAFKSQNQTQTLENLLKASKAATFTDFAQEVQSTVKDYNINYLKAEWNTAKMACRSAKRWAKAVEDADLFSNIEYTPSTAIDPRDIHKPYYGMILSMDDPLLDSILPPSIWGCQCGWRTTDKAITKAPKGVPPPSPGLDNNPGKDGALFSTSHPYIIKGKKDAAAILKSNISEMYGIDEKEIIDFYHDPKTNGCYFSIEKLAKTEKVANKRIAKVYADRGAVVELYGSNDLDSTINGTWNEFKSQNVFKSSTIDTMLRNKNRQFKNRNLKGDITLELVGNIDNASVISGLKDRASRGTIKNIENVHFIVNGKYAGKSTIEELVRGITPLK